MTSCHGSFDAKIISLSRIMISRSRWLMIQNKTALKRWKKWTLFLKVFPSKEIVSDSAMDKKSKRGGNAVLEKGINNQGKSITRGLDCECLICVPVFGGL